MVELSNTHIKYITYWCFMDKIKNHVFKHEGTRKNLENLCMLFGLSTL